MRTQNGNALFLILIAVALFAALSYAITQSSRGGGTIEKEQAMLDQGVENLCTAHVEQAVERLEIIGGCTEDQISYELSDGTNANPDAPEDKHCHVFDVAGAGETPCGSYLTANGGVWYYNGGGFSTGTGVGPITLTNFSSVMSAALAAYHDQYGSYPGDLSSGASGGGCGPAGGPMDRPCFDAILKDGGLGVLNAGNTRSGWDITGSRRYCHHSDEADGAYDHCYSYDSGTGTFTDHGGTPD